MEVPILPTLVLGLLLLPLLTILLMALCMRCRELPDSYGSTAHDSLTPSILIKRPPMVAPWTPASLNPPVSSYLPLSQPDLLVRTPRSPQPTGGSHRMPSSQQDSDDANSVASYENEEPTCEDEDEDEDEDDYHNEGYLEVLPDTVPATCNAVPAGPVPSNPGLRDRASMGSVEDYVNIPESEGSADASLDGSREYVNVSQELKPMAGTEPAILSSQEAEDEEEEGAPDYENLQELH